jgi:hypothetical protein
MNERLKNINLAATAAAGPVYVKMPSAALYDFDRFVEVQKNILDLLGCPCTSGFDIRYIHHDRFVVNERLEVSPAQFEQFSG